MAQLPDGLHSDVVLPETDDFHALFTSGVALLDTRAPVEFAEGAFPTAVNLPLMTDEERQQVGTCYKAAGQEEAIRLGMSLVSGEIRAQRLQQWQQFVQQHPEGVLYCFRGGLRSRITQQWIYEQTGIRYPRVRGGYKALRRYLLEQLETLPGHYQSVILSGRTGSGKTLLLKTLTQQIDLEGLANHRGSAFGPQPTPQPTQIDFENRLAICLLKQLATGHDPLLFEDESPNIGSVHIPVTVFRPLREAPMVVLEVDNEQRAEISYQEYVVDMNAAFQQQATDSEQGFAAFRDYLLNSLQKIKRRLGGVRYEAVRKMMNNALAIQQQHGDTEAHRQWVEVILFDYYDPMYDYQLSQKSSRIVFRGHAAEVREYLHEQGIS
ncbi:MAG: tRNA 2-selenouridine(34) synthase MnmH [Thiothrix nivea]|nr:MAG: tRNA 2-selenouridine(34) synthase MnmH [Thiothrix nivea]